MKQEQVNIEVVSIDDLIQDDHTFLQGKRAGCAVVGAQLPRMWRGSLGAD